MTLMKVQKGTRKKKKIIHKEIDGQKREIVHKPTVPIRRKKIADTGTICEALSLGKTDMQQYNVQ